MPIPSAWLACQDNNHAPQVMNLSIWLSAYDSMDRVTHPSKPTIIYCRSSLLCRIARTVVLYSSAIQWRLQAILYCLLLSAKLDLDKIYQLLGTSPRFHTRVLLLHPLGNFHSKNSAFLTLGYPSCQLPLHNPIHPSVAVVNDTLHVVGIM